MVIAIDGLVEPGLQGRKATNALQGETRATHNHERQITKNRLAPVFCYVEYGLAYLARDSGSSSRILPSISLSTRGLATTMLPEVS